MFKFFKDGKQYMIPGRWKKTTLIEFTHQNKSPINNCNVFWIKTYGLDSWCIETDIDTLPELVDILREFDYLVHDYFVEAD